MITVALAGNPNVGKSTIFNKLTKMKQHTGNWIGKTIDISEGNINYKNTKYKIIDIPGTYSLLSNSLEEDIARDYICFKNPNITVIVCDASCISRNLNLVLQTLEITKNVILCINFIDEANKKGIKINIPLLEERIKIPVIPMSATKNKGFEILMSKIHNMALYHNNNNIPNIKYDDITENAINIMLKEIESCNFKNINKRWLSIKLLEGEYEFIETLKNNIKNIDENDLNKIKKGLKKSYEYLSENKISNSKLRDNIATNIIKLSEKICQNIIYSENQNINYNLSYSKKDRKIDKILTDKYIGFPIMFILLIFILWLTITGANYPSKMLSNLLFSIENDIYYFIKDIGTPIILCDMLVFGVYRVLSWVISVMLPPMAIFFPLFTLLEDLGYLPRIAFNLDKCFKKCNACGKQALSMAMGFGCNSAGVTGCRIINSPRERLIAIITNSFVPCNGKFPTLIAIITMFFVTTNTLLGSIISATMLSFTIIWGIIITLIISKILGNTILKGYPSSITLEMPPYRKPQITKVIIRSIFDKTLFILGRAIIVSAPAGLIIWLMSNTFIGNSSILNIVCNFLDPFASLFGLDGVILTAFILGFPANEIILPIIIMTYIGNSTLIEMENIFEIKKILISNGWTFQTALSVMIFSLMHWPCSTTCLTIKKETNSTKWTIISILIPTICGLLICGILNLIINIF